MSTLGISALLASRNVRLVDVARLAGVNKSTVTRWFQRQVPAERVLEVERITGVPRHDLRPDLYPLPAPSTRGQ